MGGGDSLTRIGGDDSHARAGTPQAAVHARGAQRNGDPARFADTGLPVIPTMCRLCRAARRHSCGTGLAAAHAPEVAYVASARRLSVSCRAILVAHLQQARAASGQPLACARSGEWRHPVVGVWRSRSAPICACADQGRPPQDRTLDRAARRRTGGLAGCAGRSVLQRQHAKDAAAAERLATQYPGI